MKRINEDKDFDKIVLVSWDGDYIKLVKYLIGKNLFKKILFPSKQYSSLYKQIKKQYWMNLGMIEIKEKIMYRKNKQKKEVS